MSEFTPQIKQAFIERIERNKKLRNLPIKTDAIRLFISQENLQQFPQIYNILIDLLVTECGLSLMTDHQGNSMHMWDLPSSETLSRVEKPGVNNPSPLYEKPPSKVPFAKPVRHVNPLQGRVPRYPGQDRSKDDDNSATQTLNTEEWY